MLSVICITMIALPRARDQDQSKPVVNILIRTCYRPNHFSRMLESIRSQTYKNVRLIVSYDDDRALEYLRGVHAAKVRVHKNPKISTFYNLYCNELLKMTKKGLVLFLDDDDCFAADDALERIVKNVKAENDIVFWKFQQAPGQIVFPETTTNIRPGAVANSGSIFHSSYSRISRYEPGQAGDFTFIENLLKNSKFNVKFDANIYTKTQDDIVGHYGEDLND